MPCVFLAGLYRAERTISLATLSLVATLGGWGAGPARSAEITVYLNQATATGVRELAAGFEQATVG